MDPLAIFGLQLVLSVIVYALIAKWYVTPWLAEKPIHQAFIPLITPHAFRHIGLTFFVPGVVAQPLPSFFADTAAYGDLISALLALLSLVALRGGWGLALPFVWLFNTVGTVDLLKPDTRDGQGRKGQGRLSVPDTSGKRSPSRRALLGYRTASSGRELL